MFIHSPACVKFLDELLTAAIDPVDAPFVGVIRRLSDESVRDYLLTVIDEDHGTRPAEIALQIWHLAATTEGEQR